MKIVPAILTDREDVFIRMLNLCREFTDYIQIDIMDGEFVPSKSVPITTIEKNRGVISSEAHLMVRRPQLWLEAFKRFGTERIIYHYEIDTDHRKAITQIREHNFSVGLAVNPSTELEEFRDLVEEVDTILFMTVNPGFYGSKFIPGVIDKIKRFRKLFPEKEVGIDGGVKLNNINLVADLGLDYICIGSAILNSSDPQEAYLNFKRIVNG